MVPGTVSEFPHESTRLPARSKMSTEGACSEVSSSSFVISRRLVTTRWSWASTQMPPVRPMIHRSGNGLGHQGSTSNFGPLFWACNGRGERQTATPSHAQVAATKMMVFFISTLQCLKRHYHGEHGEKTEHTVTCIIV